MTTHCVIANNGFISRPMSAFEAYKYGRELDRLGNYDIWVVGVNHAAEFKNSRYPANAE
jgi:hypothetical protein